jgi:hypothetical protein
MVRRYSAAIVLLGLWVLLLAAHGMLEYTVSTEPHATPPWALEWARAAVENLQSEVWQVALAAWVFKHFFWKGSPESKDTP